MLDLGCGIGRLSHAMVDRVDRVVGIDVSKDMIREAKRRSSGLVRPAFLVSSGTDLRAFGEARFDLVVACDAFPYLVESGLQARMLQEISRVLVTGGQALLFHYSYRGDLEDDCSELEALAAGARLRVLRWGERPLRHWDAPVFQLQRLPSAGFSE